MNAPTPNTKNPIARTLRRRTPGRRRVTHDLARRTLRRLTRAPAALTIAAAGLLLTACGGVQPSPEPAVVMTPPPAEATPVTPTATVPVAEAPIVKTADARLTRAQAAIDDARAVRADLYASANLRVAMDRAQTAKDWRYDGRYLDAIGQAHLAQHAAVAAYREAKPKYDAAVARAEQYDANRQLVLALINKSPTNPRITSDGIEVPVYGAFLPLDDTLSANGVSRLEQLSAIAKAHDDFRIEVEAARPDSDSPTDALNYGQSRAVVAGEYLEALGVADARVTTTGQVDDTGRHLTVRFVPTRG